MTAFAPVPAERWPLVLSGPVVRRVEAAAVSVFVACARPRTIRLSLHPGNGGELVHAEDGHTLPLGRFLHVAVVTARPAVPLAAGGRYAYDLAFAGPEGVPAEDLRGLGLLDRVGYPPGGLPTFVVPPERLEQVRLVHGSCRKPHGGRRDALATLDQILAATHTDPLARPQQAFHTGDQIYADQVDPALLTLAGAIGSAALGWDPPEVLPGVAADDFRLAPTRRTPLVRGRAGYTGPHLESHLMSLAEYYGMYLLVWSDALWPRDAAGRLTLTPPEDVFDGPRWRAPAHRRERERALAAAAHTRIDTLEFARTLPRVRRALANVANYMICDDHDVTDDWNLHRQWIRTVYGRPLGRRMVANALASYAVFQAWGNDPDQFAPGRPGGRLLASLGRWDGTAGDAAEEIAASLGLPSTRRVPPVRWDYAIDTPCSQVVVLDTRTRRGFPAGGSGRAAPALLGKQALREQLADRRVARHQEGPPAPVTLVVSAAPVFGHPFIEAWVQLKRIKAIEWFRNGPAAVDREAWALNRTGFEALLAELARFGRVVILSGDVHYGFAGSIEYWDRRSGTDRPARFVQCTASAFKGEDHRTRLVGGVPTVQSVPTVLGSGLERLLARLTSPPPVNYWGWSSERRASRLRFPRLTGLSRLRRGGRDPRGPVVRPLPLGTGRRLLGEPDWRYRVDFHSDPADETAAPGRSSEAHRRAVALRAQQGWSLMHCIVGRNNLGDVEFLGPDGEEPDTLRQSLWFDKTSIREGDEPARLPYTVYDLPLTLPPADQAPAVVRGW